MDKIRELACELAIRTSHCFVVGSTSDLIGRAKLWEEYLRSPLPGDPFPSQAGGGDPSEFPDQYFEDYPPPGAMGDPDDEAYVEEYPSLLTEEQRQSLAEALERRLDDPK